jgi:RNA polymerase subunit RPABC4/transcription elongation factor Spt4
VKHDLTQCTYLDSRYHHKSTRQVGYWMNEYRCPVCQREGKFHRNWLGQRIIMCDGTKFTKVLPERTQ